MQRKIWINGNYINWEDAQVHILSHSHQRGSLIFGFIPIFDNEGVVSIFRLNDHIDRLFTSCISAGIPLDYSFEEIYFAIKDTVRKNPGSKFVKISVYISSIEVDVVPQDPFSTVAIAAYDPQEDIISKNTQPFHSSKELSVWLEKEKHQRRSDIIPPQIKIAGNYTSSMMAKWQARKNGYDEIILTDENGFNKWNVEMSNGEIGCSLSHVKVYKKLIESKYNIALILEDDAVFLKPFSKILSNL